MIEIPFSQGSSVLQRLENFESKYINPRNVDIWFPPDYSLHKVQRCPVIYMQDGQNLFDPAFSFVQVDWGMDEALTRLSSQEGLPSAIVVGIWHGQNRWQEYMPQKFMNLPLEPSMHAGIIDKCSGDPISDQYLKFVVTELKPFVDATFRTLPDSSHSFVMGSSMGGLISLYAVCEYPHIFGGAGCLSTHWPAGENSLIDYFGKHLPEPDTHKFYFDYGTVGLDADYEPYQQRMDEYLKSAGYQSNKNWVTLKFEGADHSEAFWRARVHKPLSFLLG